MAWISCTSTVEMELPTPLYDVDGNILYDVDGNILTGFEWVDVSADVLADTNPTWTHGNSGRTLSDRVANIGTFQFGLDNSSVNAAGTLGYWSPDRTDKAETFGLDTAVRISITEGANTHHEWQGTIAKITPMAGVYKERRTLILCEDLMAHYARDIVRGITVQTSKRDDQILTTLLTLTPHIPQATDFSTGDDAYAYALHDENSQKTTLLRVFQKLMISGLGRLDLTGFGTLSYRSRSNLLLSGTPLATFSDDMQELQVARNKNQRVQQIQVITYPVQVDSSPAVLWAAQRQLTLTAGQSTTFDVSLRDPSGRATRVAATSLVAAVADTDYKFSTVQGSGNDLNSSLGKTYTLKADIVTITLINNSASTGYLWFHQIRGYATYLYEPVAIIENTGQADGEILIIDMIYQDDPAVGQDIATLASYWYSLDQTDIESLTFIANKSQAFMDAAFLNPGDLISISETLTGINGSYLINGTKKTIKPGQILEVTFYPITANQLSNTCRLDVVGLAELDDTAILGA